MEHFPEAYLKRQNTCALCGFLQTVQLKEDWENYAYIIPQIIQELESRGATIDHRFLAAWQAFLAEN